VDELLSVSSAVRYIAETYGYRITTGMLRRWVKRGRLPGRRDATGRALIARADIDALHTLRA